MRAHIPILHLFNQKSLITNKIAILTIATNYMVVGFSEVDFLDTNETDLNPIGTAFADYCWYNQTTTLGAGNAFDNNNSSDWVGADSNEFYLYRLPTRWWCEFTAELAIANVAVRCRNIGSVPEYNAPMIFQIMRWTGTAWQPIKAFFETDWGTGERRIFNIAALENQTQHNKRVWAVNLHNAQNGGAPKSLAAVNFWESGVDIAAGKKVFGETRYGTPPSNVVDGDINTWWAGGDSTHVRLVLDLGAVHNPTSVSLTSRNDGGYSQAPGDFSIEYFDFITSEWVAVTTVTGLTWSPGETKTISI